MTGATPALDWARRSCAVGYFSNIPFCSLPSSCWRSSPMVETALIERAVGPRQLRGPADLAFDLGNELLDFVGGGDALRLLRQVPAITELAQIDASGREQLKVSRLTMDVVGSGIDYSHKPEFTQALIKEPLCS